MTNAAATFGETPEQRDRRLAAMGRIFYMRLNVKAASIALALVTGAALLSGCSTLPGPATVQSAAVEDNRNNDGPSIGSRSGGARDSQSFASAITGGGPKTNERNISVGGNTYRAYSQGGLAVVTRGGRTR